MKFSLFLLIPVKHLGLDLTTLFSHGKNPYKINKIWGESSFTETEVFHSGMKVFGNFDAHKIYPNELSEKKLWESGFFSV